MRIRPTDVKAVAALLVEGAETPEALARLVIEALETARIERDEWALMTGERDLAIAYGPYPTYNAAMRDVEKSKVATLARLSIGRLVHPERARRNLTAHDHYERSPK